MRTWDTVAFVLLVVATVAATFDKAWTIALIAAGLACTLIPTVFALTG